MELDKWLNDLAVTLKVHPAYFGITKEADGRYSFPDDALIQATVAKNLWQYARYKRGGGISGTQRINLNQEGEVPIDVEMLHIVSVLVRAVVVVEHRNFGVSLDWIQNNHQRVIFIMVSPSVDQHR